MDEKMNEEPMRIEGESQRAEGNGHVYNSDLIAELLMFSNEIHEMTAADPTVKLVVPNNEQGRKTIGMMRRLGVVRPVQPRART